MSFPPYALYAYLAGVLFSVGAWICGKDKVRTMAGNVLLALLTIFVVHFLVVAVSTQRIGKSNPAVATETAEMQLRLVSCYDSLRRHTIKDASSIIGKTLGPPAKPTEQDSKQRLEAFETNEKALSEAIKANPKNAKYYAKLIVLLADMPHGADTTAKIKHLNGLLMEGGLPADKQHQLAKALNHIYVEKQVEADEVKPFSALLKENLPQGWFLDHGMEHLLQAAGEKKALEAYQEEEDTRNILTFFKFVVIAIGVIIAGLVGVVNIFVQLAMTSRAKQPPKPDAIGLPVSPKILFGVFVAWFSIQIVMSSGAHLFMANNPQILQEPQAVALTTMVTYLITNVPGLLLIYFLALKPRGLNLQSGLRLTAKTSTSGPFKLIACGILASFSAIPLVLITAIVASKFLHVQGSDNPVISQIIQAASSTNPIAIFVFYFTIGALAPFFEEILFRGFLYGGLKNKIGAPLAMIASALTFAALHLDKGGALMLFAIGFVLAYTYDRTRSLLSSMVAHGLWNSGVFTVVLTLFST